MRTLSALVWIGLVACNAEPAGPTASPPRPPPPAPAAPVAARPTAHHVQVHVDRRIELMSIVERLAGAEEYTKAPPTAYVADVDRAFAPFAKHAAVALTRQLREQSGIAYDAPMRLAVHLDDQFRPRGQLSTVLPAADERWAGVAIDGYVAALQAFAADAKLDDFFAAHRAYYAAVEDRFQSRLDAEDPATWFDAFFGPSGAKFIVVPGLLEGPGNYGVRADLPPALEMFQVIGVYNLDDHGLPVIDEEMIETVIHEMAHSFVNPIFDRHMAELLPAGEAIYKLVQPAMDLQAYSDARIMLDEAGVRAVVVQYVRDRKGAQAAADATFGEVARMFIWTAELADVFAAYRTSGKPTFDAYMPAVVGFFNDLAKRYASGLPPTPFRGTIDGVGSGKVAVVVSTEPAVASYARAIHDRFFKVAPFVVASAQSLTSQPNAGIVAYGTPATNPVIAELAARAHWSITDGEIRLGARTFSGPGLVLIACWPRPDDPTRGIVAYTAGRASDIVDINSVVAGSTDWVVARKRPDGKFERIERGNFGHAIDGTWLAPVQ